MASAPRALQIGDTVYRMEEIGWIKFQRLTRFEQVARWGLIALGIVFFLEVGAARGAMLNAEGFLGLVPILIGLQITGANRLASSGDIEDGYVERRMSTEATPARLAPLLKAYNPGMLELSDRGAAYHYFIQASRVAWASPWSSISWGGLWSTLMFGAYLFVLSNGYRLPDLGPLKEWRIFEFPTEGGLMGAEVLAGALALLGLFSVVASFKTGLRLAAVGGLTDGLPLTTADRKRLVDYLTGSRSESLEAATEVRPASSTPVAVLAAPASAASAPSASSSSPSGATTVSTTPLSPGVSLAASPGPVAPSEAPGPHEGAAGTPSMSSLPVAG